MKDLEEADKAATLRLSPQLRVDAEAPQGQAQGQAQGEPVANGPGDPAAQGTGPTRETAGPPLRQPKARDGDAPARPAGSRR